MSGPPRRLGLALLLLLAACGRADLRARTAQGQAALARGDADLALVHFDDALLWLEPEDEGYLAASLGRCYALARLEPARAVAEFRSLAAAEGLAPREYELMAHELVDAGAHDEAARLAEASLATFGASPARLALREWVAGKAAGLEEPEPADELEDEPPP